MPESPEEWLITWLTLIFSFPLAANSGQYLATGASKSSNRRDRRATSAVSAVMVFVVE